MLAGSRINAAYCSWYGGAVVAEINVEKTVAFPDIAGFRVSFEPSRPQLML